MNSVYVYRVFGWGKILSSGTEIYKLRTLSYTRHDVVMNLGMWYTAYYIGARLMNGDRYEFNECKRWYKNRSFEWESGTLSVPTI